MIIVCYAAAAMTAEIVAGDDAEAAAWFNVDEIPWDLLAFDSSHRGLRDDLRRGSA
jgi:ADP-ribose pyrophosphatase YjhB (NUDIX family)